MFFPRILKSLPPLPRQHSAAIGCTKNYQQIGATVHSHCVESFDGLLQRCRREGGVAVNCEKITIFPEHPVYYLNNKHHSFPTRSKAIEKRAYELNPSRAGVQT